MRKINFSILAMAAVLLAAGFVFTACDTGTGGGGGGGTMTYTGNDGSIDYTLTITQSPAKAAYNPKPGDLYVLVFGSARSEGEVQTFSASKFTLKPRIAETKIFDVTVNGSNGITGINKTITLIDGTSRQPPAELHPGRVGGVGVEGDGSELLDAQGNISPAKLVGTVWSAKASPDEKVYITFTSTTTIRETHAWESRVQTYTYTISGKNITMKVGNDIATGTFNGNTMDCIGIDGEPVLLYREK
jgi:hypothetical protein